MQTVKRDNTKGIHILSDVAHFYSVGVIDELGEGDCLVVVVVRS